MFDWLKNLGKPTKETYPTWADIPPWNADNVYNLPTPKEVPPMPQVKPEKEPEAKIFYRLGLTDNNRVAFSMGNMEITMNDEGCQQMIDQLTFFKSQLYDENDNGGGGGPDGGEPVPVPTPASEPIPFQRKKSV
jgi:hypothetical protein